MRILTSIQGATDLPTWEILPIPCDQPGEGVTLALEDAWTIGKLASAQLAIHRER